jgi:hypothetical protein
MTTANRRARATIAIVLSVEALQTSVRRHAMFYSTRGTRLWERSNEKHIVRPKFISALDSMALAWLRIMRS